MSLCWEEQAPDVRIGDERLNGCDMTPEQFFDMIGGAISDHQSNQLRRKTPPCDQVVEVGVFRYDRKIMTTCVVPNVYIRSLKKTDEEDVSSSRRDIS